MPSFMHLSFVSLKEIWNAAKMHHILTNMYRDVSQLQDVRFHSQPYQLSFQNPQDANYAIKLTVLTVQQVTEITA